MHHPLFIVLSMFFKNYFRLRIMHDRFLNRESREEDVELIDSLKQALNDRENYVRTLNVSILIYILQKRLRVFFLNLFFNARVKRNIFKWSSSIEKTISIKCSTILVPILVLSIL